MNPIRRAKAMPKNNRLYRPYADDRETRVAVCEKLRRALGESPQQDFANRVSNKWQKHFCGNSLAAVLL
jgi:hypothetical protein